jgi:hypothetical protein
MVISIAFALGMREESVLTCFFMLTWTTMMLGLSNEIYSRPASGDEWQGDRENGKCRNYLRRMWPHFLGWFPFLTVWALIGKFLYTTTQDLRELRSDPGANMPDWVVAALVGTFVLYTSFAPVQAVYTYLAPKHYWGSEVRLPAARGPGVAHWMPLAGRVPDSLASQQSLFGAVFATECDHGRRVIFVIGRRAELLRRTVMDLDLEKNAAPRQATYACLGVGCQLVGLAVFVAGVLWATAALLETTHLLGVDTLPGGVVHLRVG